MTPVSGAPLNSLFPTNNTQDPSNQVGMEQLTQSPQLLAFLEQANTMTGGQAGLSNLLTQGRDGVTFRIVRDEDINGSFAEFSAKDNQILLSNSLVSDAIAALSELSNQGIVDAQGNIVNQQGFRDSQSGVAAINFGATVDHEAEHASSSTSGQDERLNQIAQLIYNGDWNETQDPGSLPRNVVDAAVVAAQLTRGQWEGNEAKGTKMLSYMLHEYQATLNMEQRFGPGEQANSVLGKRLTTDDQGNALDPVQAMQNLAAVYLGHNVDDAANAVPTAMQQQANNPQQPVAFGSITDERTDDVNDPRRRWG